MLPSSVASSCPLTPCADDEQGDFETIQHAGTCYFRCILTAFRYLMKQEGLTKAQRKQVPRCKGVWRAS